MDDVFDPDIVREWHIELPSESLGILLADPEAERYTNCTITHNGDTFEGCGCRFKGSGGSLSRCMRATDGGPIQLPLADLHSSSCRSFSWKVDANQFREDKQRFYGLKKLQFHSMSSTKDYIRERICYEMMNLVAITSRAVHVKLFINGVFEGLFLLVEQIDDRFTRDRFGYDENDGDGSLYKEVWPNALDPDFYEIYQESDGGGPKGQVFVDFALAVQDVEEITEQEATKLVDQFWHADQIARMSAVLTLQNHYEEFHSVLCINAARGCGSLVIRGREIESLTGDGRYHHNFFVYMEEIDDSSYLYPIPWDFTNALIRERFDCQVGDSSDPCNVHDFKWNVPFWWEQTWEGSDFNNCEPKKFTSAQQIYNIAFTCEPSGKIMSLGTRQQWKNYVLDFAENVFTNNWFTNRVLEIQGLIRHIVEIDPLTDIEIREWDAEVLSLISDFTGTNGIRQEAIRLASSLETTIPVNEWTEPPNGVPIREPLRAESSDESPPDYDADDIFNPDLVQSWELEINAEDLGDILERPTYRKYYPCTVIFDNYRFEGAGCQLKDDIDGCMVDGDDRPVQVPISDFASTSCRYVSWTVDANEFRDDSQRFFGMKKLEFHSMTGTDDYIRERIGFEMLAEVASAPQAAHIKFYLNGAYVGLFLLVETVDDIYTQERYKYDDNGGDGTLYKDVWPNVLDATFYKKYEIQGGGGEFGNTFVSFAYLSNASATVVSEDQAAVVVDQFFHSDQLARVSAVLTLQNQYFDFHTVLCEGSVACGAVQDASGLPDYSIDTLTKDGRFHSSYYLYMLEQESRQKLHLIHSDSRFTLLREECSSASDKSPECILYNLKHSVPFWWDFENQVSCGGQRVPGIANMWIFPFLCDPVGRMISLATRKLWKTYVVQFAEQHFTNVWFTTRVQEIASQISSIVSRDPLSAISLADWGNAVQKLIDDFVGPSGIRQEALDLASELNGISTDAHLCDDVDVCGCTEEICGRGWGWCDGCMYDCVTDEMELMQGGCFPVVGADTQVGVGDKTTYCGNCVQSSLARGCDIEDIQTCVCGYDQFCCDIMWDDLCVAQAHYLCGCSGDPQALRQVMVTMCPRIVGAG